MKGYCVLISVFLVGAVSCKGRNQDADSSAKGVAPSEKPPFFEEPPLSSERLEIDQEVTQKVLAATKSIVERNLASAVADTTKSTETKVFDSRLRATRDTHAKTHGCLRGDLTVNQNIDPSVATGLFAVPGKRYPAIARFANGKSKIEADSASDARGMAIKIVDPNGPQPVEITENASSATFDFIANNAPVFFVKDPSEYYKFLIDAREKSAAHFLLLWGLRIRPVTARKPASPLSEIYYSGNALRWGRHAAKYIFRPCRGSKERSGNPTDPNFLRAAMVSALEAPQTRSSQCFTMSAQILDLTDAANTKRLSPLVEDTTIDWADAKTHEYPVAQLNFEPQRFSTDELLEYCENLSFNTWRVPVEHRPLGALSRLRKVTYKAVSDLRHQINQKEDVEPGALDLNPISL